MKLSTLTQVGTVNQLTMTTPDRSTTTPASRSSSGVLLMVSGSDQVSPLSLLRTIWVLPKGQACSSRSPENATSSSPLSRRAIVGQAR